MNMSQEIINQGLGIIATTGLKKFTNEIIEIYLKPKLLEMKDKKETEEIEFFVQDFTEYIERSYNKNLHMSTIVFRNQRKTVDDLYIPLTVKKCKSIGEDDSIEFYIDKYDDEFVPKYKKILLVDSAGMGKSTLMKFLYLKSISQNKGIPILIELRKLNKETSIIDFIKNEIDGISVHFKREEIIELIERGDFIFFFDGYDEINQDSKNVITDNIQDFISKSGNNCFIISSRDENELSSFGDFQRFDIKRLKKEEVYNLIYKYDKNGELSEELVQKLETENNLKLINEFLDNPLMVSLLYKAFDHKKTIPYKKHVFYRQVYDALFEEHDLTKGGAYVHGKKSQLDVEDFHKVLRKIGFLTLPKGIEYQKEELIKIIEDVKKQIIEVDFKTADLMYDLTCSVPLFIKEGNQYRWIHKSFQDYFAACYICYDEKKDFEKILKRISQPDKIRKYYNILDFCYDIDYIEFAKSVIYPILQDLESFTKNSYTDNKYSGYDQDELMRRKIILFRNNKIRFKKLNKEEVAAISKRSEKENIPDFDIFFNKENSTYMVTSIAIGYNKGVEFSEKRDIAILIKLLYDKKSDIVFKQPNYSSKYTLINKKLTAGTYVLDDNINNELNKKEFFKEINDYLEEMGSNVSNNGEILNLDFSKCMDLKNEIDKKINTEPCDFNFL